MKSHVFEYDFCKKLHILKPNCTNISFHNRIFTRCVFHGGKLWFTKYMRHYHYLFISLKIIIKQRQTINIPSLVSPEHKQFIHGTLSDQHWCSPIIRLFIELAIKQFVKLQGFHQLFQLIFREHPHCLHQANENIYIHGNNAFFKCIYKITFQILF